MRRSSSNWLTSKKTEKQIVGDKPSVPGKRRGSTNLGRRSSAFTKDLPNAVQQCVEANMRKQGVLSKKTTGMSRSVKRYFFVEGPYLKYYESEAKKGVVKGFIYLPDAKQVGYTAGCHVNLSIGNNKTVLVAPDEASTIEWLAAMQDASALDDMLDQIMRDLEIPGEKMAGLKEEIYSGSIAEFAGVGQVTELTVDSLDNVKPRLKGEIVQLLQSGEGCSSGDGNSSGSTSSKPKAEMKWDSNPMRSRASTALDDLRATAQAQAREFQALAKEHKLRKEKRESIQTGVGVAAAVFSGRITALYALQRKITEQLDAPDEAEEDRDDDDEDEDEDEQVPVLSDEDEEFSDAEGGEEGDEEGDEEEPEQEGVIRRKDTAKIGVLGEGAFGSISLIVHKGRKYACKQLLQIDLEQMGEDAAEDMQKQFDSERLLLAEVRHPFILALLYTILAEEDAGAGDATTLGGGSAIVLEWMPGGDLGGRLKAVRKENNNVVCGLGHTAVQYYSASMLLALEFLHDKNIVHRDIKPENMLIAANGHCKLADFGFAKQLQSDDEKTLTFLGSPLYMAPEGIMKSGTGKGGDIWAMAATMYELCTGKCLFDNPAKSGQLAEIFLLVLTCKSKGPPFRKGFKEESTEHAQVAELMNSMLLHDPMKRSTAAEAKAHGFFAGLDTEALLGCRLPTPFVPISEQPTPAAGATAAAETDAADDNAEEADMPVDSYVAVLNQCSAAGEISPAEAEQLSSMIHRLHRVESALAERAGASASVVTFES